MDGTLWDSSDHVAKSWDQVVRKEKNGLREITREDIQNVMGLTMTDIAKTLFPMLDEEEAIALTDRCGEYENAYLRMHGGMLYPRLEETLKILAERYPLYIVSNCQKGYIEAFLDYYGFWKYFQDTECFGNNNMGKAFNIGLVVKRNGHSPWGFWGRYSGRLPCEQRSGCGFCTCGVRVWTDP